MTVKRATPRGHLLCACIPLLLLVLIMLSARRDRTDAGFVEDTAFFEDIDFVSHSGGKAGAAAAVAEAAGATLDGAPDAAATDAVTHAATSNATPSAFEADLDCPAATLASLSAPDAWSVRRATHFDAFIVFLRDTTHVDSACARHAVFSARLVTPNEDPATATVFALDAPVHVGRAQYRFQTPAAAQLKRIAGAADALRVEVTLEFGFLNGGATGDLCGPAAETCRIRDVTSPGYVGAPLTFERPTEALMNLHQAEQDAPVETPCDPAAFSDLQGVWRSLTFHPVAAQGQMLFPCKLATPHAPFRLGPSAQSVHWIHFVGDSNPRNLYTHLIAALGAGYAHSAETHTSTTHNGTVASVALRSFSGEYDRRGKIPPDIIVTWNWWFETASGVDANAADLKALVGGSLGEFLTLSGLASSVLKDNPQLKPFLGTRPTRTYMSLGSHSEDLSAHGAAASIATLFGPNYVNAAMRHAANLRIFTTTFVKSDYIPQAKFPHQDVLRNNAVIHAKNEVLKANAVLRPLIIDAEALTRGLTAPKGYMKGEPDKLDAVHFRKEIYDEWVRLLWTDLAT